MTADVVVIGAGCAGLAAATRLAAAGRRVVVYEQAPRLGGRATAFVDRESGEAVDNGQHVLFGCYRATFEWLREIGSADRVTLESRLELPMADGRGKASTLVCPMWRPPWHLVGGVLRWRALGLADRLSAAKLAGVIRAVRREGAEAVASRVPNDMTVTDWLSSHRQSPALCHWLWRPLAIAALNQSPEVAAAKPFVRVLGELFGPRPEDSAIALPSVPLDELMAEPARRFIEARGGEVRLRTAARVMFESGRAIGIETGGELVRSSAVVCAVAWHALERACGTDVPAALKSTIADASRMASEPIVSANLWFDRPVLGGRRLVGLVDGAMQWAFDKRAMGARDASHIAMVSSGAVDLLRLENGEITEIALRDLHAAVPASRDATLRRSLVIREPRATFSLAPGGPPRPRTESVTGLYLAGDWTDTGLPATIEGAVMSGVRAATAILSSRAL